MAHPTPAQMYRERKGERMGEEKSKLSHNHIHGHPKLFRTMIALYVRSHRCPEVPNVNSVKTRHGVLLLLSSKHQCPLRVNLCQGELVDGWRTLACASQLCPCPCTLYSLARITSKLGKRIKYGRCKSIIISDQHRSQLRAHFS